MTVANNTHYSASFGAIRGGRMTKWKGTVGSLTPMMGYLFGSASSSALATAALLAAPALMLTAGPAAAQNICTETAVGSGVFECTGSSTDTQLPMPAAATPLVVTLDDTVTVDTTLAGGSGGNAFDITGNSGLTFEQAARSMVTGAVHGVDADSNGGSLTIDALGTAIGQGQSGINAVNQATGTDLTIMSNIATGNFSGIRGYNTGTGALSITSTRTATGTNNNGINALNDGTSLDINAVDTTGGLSGIRAFNSGSGALSITLTGTATGTGTFSDGISAFNNSGATDLTIEAMNASGNEYGIYGQHFGSGALSISSTGTVTGTDISGIRASTSSAGTSLSINAGGEVTGGIDGIAARSLGTAGLTIQVSGDVTGGGGDGISAFNTASNATSSMYINQAEGTITTGAVNGIDADNGGGSLTINALGTVIGQTNNGINAINQVTATDLTITSNIATGRISGISANNNGTGALLVTSTGTARGTIFGGIYARNQVGATDLTVNAVDTRGLYGIYSQNLGTGALSITSTGTATGGNGGGGIVALNSITGTDLTISSANANGGANGIFAQNNGTGAFSITSTGTASGTDVAGIRAINATGATDITINAADTNGGAYGLYIRNLGTGALSITSTGTATGTTDAGILAANDAGTDLTIDAVDSSGGNDGINAINSGSGALTITTTGASVGTNGEGIRATNNSGTDLTIQSNITTGNFSGINANNNGTGALSVTSTGTASGTGVAGILTLNGMAGTDLTVDATDTSGGNHGIYGQNLGTGALSITSTGTATGTVLNGITAINDAGTDLIVDAVDSSGGVDGIRAFNQGSGSLTITTTGATTGTAGGGIYAINGTTATDLVIDTQGDVTGGDYGILAGNSGTGALSISSTGIVTSTNSDGIRASGDGTALDITAATTTGGLQGIRATNSGTGALSIITTGITIGTADDGIQAINNAGATSLTIDTGGDVIGSGDGIDARNLGTAGLTIRVAGDVTGSGGDGITAFNSLNDVTASMYIYQSAEMTITGAVNGIDANNAGGSLTINALGTVIGQTNNGINAINQATGTATDLTIMSNIVTGELYGISARNNGTGALTITTAGTTTGNNSYGILAFNRFTGTDLTIDAQGDVSGDVGGIFARNDGTGILSVTSTGSVTGTNNIGIMAISGTAGAGIEINAVDTTGNLSGITGYNSSSGAMSITSTGSATGTTNSGIIGLNSANSTDLTITAATTTGDLQGIRAYNFGTGTLSITTTETTTGTTNDGIFARNNAGATSLTINAQGEVIGGSNGINVRNYGTDLTIDAVDSSGGNFGIDTINSGSGALTISTAGTIVGTAGDGIRARNEASGTDLTIDAQGDVNGGNDGIDAVNIGTGALSVTSTGTATGTVDFGINAVNTGTDLEVTAVDTIGGRGGIRALHGGSGTLSVTSTGMARGTGTVGIVASSSSGTDLTVNAADSSGGLFGIYANHGGSGTLSITTTGATVATDLDGMFARNTAAGTDVTVNAQGDITGGRNGISAESLSAGIVSITTGGTVTGIVDAVAVNILSAGGTASVNNSGTLIADSGYAVRSNGVTALTNSGTINGRIRLSALDDTVANSGLFNATASSDFGAGNDLFTNNGEVRADGVITFTELESFVNNAQVTMVDDAVNDSLILTGDYEGNGELAIDVNFDGTGSADTLVIAGATTGNTSLIVNDISASPNFGNTVLVVDAGTGTGADAFALDIPASTIGFVTYDLSFEAATNDFFLSSTIGTPAFQTLKFAEGAQSLWYRSADAWAAHMASRRNVPGSALWLQVYGASADRDDSLDFSSAGINQVISLDYNQDYFGFQTGYDFGPGTDGDGALFGLTAGYLGSRLGFARSADHVSYDVFNIGAYTGITVGSFFANALAKYDFVNADVSAPTPGYTAQIDGESYGFRVESGYRLGDDKFFAEPVVSIEYQRTNLDDFSALGASIDFDGFSGLRGMAGLKLGGQKEINGSNTLTYYLGGHAVKEFQGDDGLAFTSGASSIRIANSPQDTFGRLELGVNIATPGGVTGFIEGTADISSDYKSYGGRTGLRIRF